jgi:DNA polymerase III alpha subunit (gram-positive type)
VTPRRLRRPEDIQMESNRMRDIIPFKPEAEVLKNLVVFDLETTGLSPGDDEIIQIAAMRMIDGAIRRDDCFFTYVDPGRPIDPFIVDYTGITDRDVAGAPGPQEAVRAFSTFCDSSVLVAHNGHSFDIPFLRSVTTRSRQGLRPASYIDSMHLSWQLWGRARGVSHSLDGVVSRLRVRAGDVRRHDARGDVLLLARCVEELLGRMARARRDYRLSIYRCHLPAAARRGGRA